jgi:hypothetical protein
MMAIDFVQFLHEFTKQEEYKEKVSEGEYGGILCLMYENGKMRPVETIPGMGEEGKRE